MTRYNFISSIQATIPFFFSEMKDKPSIVDHVFVAFPKKEVALEFNTDNHLMFSITFYMESFNRSKFGINLKKFNAFLGMDGLMSLNDLIPFETDDDKDSVTYYYKIPLTIAQGFKD